MEKEDDAKQHQEKDVPKENGQVLVITITMNMVMS